MNPLEDSGVAVVDASRKIVTLKIVYYGCAQGGKTTNLETLHKLTDPQRHQSMVSIATSDDRTLFFDLLPVELGRVGGLSVRAKVYTVPGQLHYEMTRRQVLIGADAVVHVVDSSPEAMKANLWSAGNLRDNLKANGFKPGEIPIVMQWNKRDLADVVPVEELERELNREKLPSFEAVATTGAGLIDTFAAVLKVTLVRTYARAGQKDLSEDEIEKTIANALSEASDRQPNVDDQPATGHVRHQVDIDDYREKWEEKGRNRKYLDQEALYNESVQAGMVLAEQIDGMNQVQLLNARREQMLEGLSKLSSLVATVRETPLPEGLMRVALHGAGRGHGSLLLFRPGDKTMDAVDCHPGRGDVLNNLVVEGLGSTAFQLSQKGETRFIEDLASEIFFDSIPADAEALAAAFLVPLRCDGLTYGSLIVYSESTHPPIDAVERGYWTAASVLVGLSLNWWSLRRTAETQKSSSAPSS